MRQPRSLLRFATVAALATSVLLPLAAGAQQRGQEEQRVYKWVDEKGVTHYGDAIPPQYAEQDKTILNSQGVQVGTIPGRRTPEQIEAAARAREAQERAEREVILARQRDQNLLATYLTVEEIESLRDRRVEILDAQARVVDEHLDGIRIQLGRLEEQARRFRPYSDAENAPPMPDQLAADLVRAVSEIAAQERNLETKREETEKLREQFAADIERFRELKRIETEYRRTAQPR